MKEKKWCEAIDEKIDATKRNKTWEIIDLPSGKQLIKVKWVYKTKINIVKE